MRLTPDEVQEATSRWMRGGILRSVCELLDAVGESPEARAAVAEAYVLGQVELLPHLREAEARAEAAAAELAELAAKLGSRRTALSPDLRDQVRGAFDSYLRAHSELSGLTFTPGGSCGMRTLPLREWRRHVRTIAEALDARPDWRTVERCLKDLGLVQQEGGRVAVGSRPTITLRIQAATPVALGILQGS